MTIDNDDFIKATKRDDGKVETDISWLFENPHEAGHILAKLIKSLIQGFEQSKTGATRDEILGMILEGIQCQIDDDFLDGDDAGSTVLPIPGNRRIN